MAKSLRLEAEVEVIFDASLFISFLDITANAECPRSFETISSLNPSFAVFSVGYMGGRTNHSPINPSKLGFTIEPNIDPGNKESLRQCDNAHKVTS
jgi:hypothetical protein